MQDCLTLQSELLQIAKLQIASEICVMFSREKWNPIAAIILNNFYLPSATRLSIIDLRIPIPDLYGFARSANVILFEAKPQIISSDGTSIAVPCCRKVDKPNLTQHQKNFVDVREQKGWSPIMYSLFFTPEWHEQGFIHFSLPEFINQITGFFASPEVFMQKDIAYCQSRWSITRNPWWLMRLVQLNEEIGNTNEAKQIAIKGKELFPQRKEFNFVIKKLNSN